MGGRRDGRKERWEEGEEGGRREQFTMFTTKLQGEVTECTCGWSISIPWVYLERGALSFRSSLLI